MNYQSLPVKEKIKVQLINLEQNENLSYAGLRTLGIIRNLLKQLES
jgi:hypothetical protein